MSSNGNWFCNENCQKEISTFCESRDHSLSHHVLNFLDTDGADAQTVICLILSELFNKITFSKTFLQMDFLNFLPSKLNFLE